MKFCTKCGNSLEDTANECELCGEMQPFSPPSPAKQPIISPDGSTYTSSSEQYQPANTYNTYNESYNQGYNPNYGYNYAPVKKTNSTCMAGFILGILSLCLFGFVTSIIGLVFSIIGVKNFNEDTDSGKGYGIAGIIMNAIPTAIFILAVIIIIIVAVINYSAGY